MPESPRELANRITAKLTESYNDRGSRGREGNTVSGLAELLAVATPGPWVFRDVVPAVRDDFPDVRDREGYPSSIILQGEDCFLARPGDGSPSHRHGFVRPTERPLRHVQRRTR